MKAINEIIRKTTTLALALILGSGIAAADVMFQAAPEGTADGMRIYRMEQPGMLRSAGQAQKLQHVLSQAGLRAADADRVVRTNELTGLAGESIEATIDATGNQIAFTDLSGLKLAGSTGELPDDAQAIEIARDFLASAGLVSLDRGELVVDHVGGLMQADAVLGYNLPSVRKAAAVYFNRELDGIRVVNSGSHITVMVGDNFAPVNMQYHWREIAAAGNAVSASELVAASDLERLITADVALVHDLSRDIVIERIYPVYYDRGGAFIQPAYCYEGFAEGEPQPMPVRGYVPALQNPPEPVHHPGHWAGARLPDNPMMIQR